MKPGVNAFLLILAIMLMAVTLGFIVRERNLQLPEYVPQILSKVVTKELPRKGVVATIVPGSGATTPVATSTRPAVPTPSIAPAMIFSSPDAVTQAVLVGYPVLTSPFTMYGTSTAFENRISWRLRDAHRKIIGEGSMDVLSPDVGIPGPFHAVGVWDSAPKTASGTLFIFEASAKDGTPIHVVTIPVTFATSTRL